MSDPMMWNAANDDGGRWVNPTVTVTALAETGIEPTADEAIRKPWTVIAEHWPGFHLDPNPDRRVSVDWRGFDPPGYVASAWIVKEVERT